MRSGEVCTSKRSKGRLLIRSQNTVNVQWSRQRRTRKCSEFSTTAEWTAPTAQRSQRGRSRVSCAPPRQEPPAPTSPTGSVPTGFTYNHAGGREEREGEPITNIPQQAVEATKTRTDGMWSGSVPPYASKLPLTIRGEGKRERGRGGSWVSVWLLKSLIILYIFCIYRHDYSSGRVVDKRVRTPSIVLFRFISIPPRLHTQF